MEAQRYIREDGKKEMWCAVTDDSPISEDMFHKVDMMGIDEDSQIALHTDRKGSITILNRMTGFGHRDTETGYRDFSGEFWLASGNRDVLTSECKTFGEAVNWIKKYANTCIGKEEN